MKEPDGLSNLVDKAWALCHLHEQGGEETPSLAEMTPVFKSLSKSAMEVARWRKNGEDERKLLLARHKVEKNRMDSDVSHRQRTDKETHDVLERLYATMKSFSANKRAKASSSSSSVVRDNTVSTTTAARKASSSRTTSNSAASSMVSATTKTPTDDDEKRADSADDTDQRRRKKSKSTTHDDDNSLNDDDDDDDDLKHMYD